MRSGKHHLYDDILLNTGGLGTTAGATDKTKAWTTATVNEEEYNFDEFNWGVCLQYLYIVFHTTL